MLSMQKTFPCLTVFLPGPVQQTLILVFTKMHTIPTVLLMLLLLSVYHCP